MAPRSTTKTAAKTTSKAAKPATGKKTADSEDPDVLVAEITEISALIAHHVPNKVKALTALRDLLSTLAEEGDDVEDAEEDGDEGEEEEAPARTTASAKAKGKGKKPDPDEDEDEDEDAEEDGEDDEEEDESLSAFPELTSPKEVAAFLAERGIDLDSYDLPAKGAKRTTMAVEIVEGLAATIESAEGDKLVVKGKKSVIDKLLEMLDEAGGSAPKRLKKHTDLMYAWMLADAINSAEAEEGDEDEDEDEE